MKVAIVVFFSLACLTSMVLTALVREVAPYFGLTDRPDGHRKLHEGPMPLGGGVAILLATVSVLGVVLVQENWFRDHLWRKWTVWAWEREPAQGERLSTFSVPGDSAGNLASLFLAMLVAALVIVVVGLLDDRLKLSGRRKLFGQILAVSLLLSIYGGLVIQKVALFGKPIELGWWLGVPVTFFWLLGAVNALNLLDGIDGLATMMGIILASTIAVMAARMGRYEVTIIGFVFAGSLVGFMRFNFPPATIFLGDTGSMLIGLVVGVLAIQGSLKGPGTVLLAAPLAVWAIPIFDTAAAILRRKLTGRSIYATDRGHLHHRLLSLLGSNRKVLAWLAICCTLTSAAALLSVFLRPDPTESGANDLFALLTCCAIVIIFIATGVFGRVEALLLGSRLRRVGRLLMPPMALRRALARKVTIRLQGPRQWELLWETFTESADKLSLREIRMDVNLPAEQEGFHASWERSRPVDREQCWRMEFPLLAADRPIGRLVIVGKHRGQSAYGDIQQLLDLIEPFETQLLGLSEQEASVLTVEDDGDLAVAQDDSSDSVALEKHPQQSP